MPQCKFGVKLDTLVFGTRNFRTQSLHATTVNHTHNEQQHMSESDLFEKCIAAAGCTKHEQLLLGCLENSRCSPLLARGAASLLRALHCLIRVPFFKVFVQGLQMLRQAGGSCRFPVLPLQQV